MLAVVSEKTVSWPSHRSENWTFKTLDMMDFKVYIQLFYDAPRMKHMHACHMMMRAHIWGECIHDLWGEPIRGTKSVTGSYARYTDVSRHTCHAW